jgi:hypothetical protein
MVTSTHHKMHRTQKEVSACILRGCWDDYFFLQDGCWSVMCDYDIGISWIELRETKQRHFSIAKEKEGCFVVTQKLTGSFSPVVSCCLLYKKGTSYMMNV